MASKSLGLRFGDQMGRLWRGYERVLQRRPVLTQATTSAVLWAAGDLVAQRLEGIGKPGPRPVDAVRAVQTAGFGAGLVGPVGHFWYLGLDRLAAALFTPGSARFIAAKVRSACSEGRRAPPAPGARAWRGRAAAAPPWPPLTRCAPPPAPPQVLLDSAVLGPFYVAGFFAYGARQAAACLAAGPPGDGAGAHPLAQPAR
jgi:hypothetical protein